MTATINGLRASSVRIHVPYVGPWFADVTVDGAMGLTGRVTIAYGQLSLVGTIDPARDGSKSDMQITRVVGGGGGWARSLVPKAYANDAGVQALLLAQDAAREAGETLGGFAPVVPVVGVSYVRQSGSAARALEDAIGATPWWVDYAGVTQVGLRATSPATTGTYEALDFHPRDHLVVIAADDMTQITIGSVLTDRLDTPQTVRGLEIRIDDETARMIAWCAPSGRDRVAELMRTIARRATDDRLFGKYRYRVVAMSGDRVQLQAVNRALGLPDIQPVSMWPGVAGAHAVLTPGAELFVEFEEGSRAKPVVVGFVGKGGPGHVPVSLAIDATTEIALGGTGASFVALASHVSTELGKIATTLATGSNSGGPVVFGTPYTPASVAATKVKAV